MRVETLRPVLSGFGAVATVASGAFAVPEQVYGQETAPASAPEDSAIRLPPVKVEGTNSPSTNALKTGTGIDRLPDALEDTPQTVTVISQVLIEQQQATTIDQVLKYVPGVTVATGEGNGGMNGDAFRIRGFDARGDIYVDGLRDFGAYVRDDFAAENIQIFKGSSSANFGNGTTGGAINLQSKTARLGNAYSLQGTIGNGPQKRLVADVNQQLGDTTALRIVGMAHDQDLVDRDHIYSKRWGLLGSLGLGLGTDGTLTLNYLHQDGDRRPDLGAPIPTGISGYAYPVTEYGVPKSNFFGKETDRDETNVDMLTLRYRKEISDKLTISNDTRFADYTRRMVFTPTLCMNGGGYFGTPLTTCASDVLAGRLDTAFTVWPVIGDTQKSSGGQNITTATARFGGGRVKHELVAGLDLYYQRNIFGSLTAAGTRTGGTLLTPDFTNPPGFTIIDSHAYDVSARASSVGVFASDRISLTERLSVVGGLRWDDYTAKSRAASTASGAWNEAETEFVSPKAALIWQRSAQQSYYISYARSFSPPGQNVKFQGTVSASMPNPSPDKNSTTEAGGRWNLVDDQLGLSAAVFRTIKNRGSYQDPLTQATVPVGEKDRVQGVELGVTGKITSAWDVQASYTYLDSEILIGPGVSAFTPVDSTGNPVAYVSKNNVALWSTYRLTSKLLIGGGVNYRSGYSADPTRLYRIPAATTVDGLISWEAKRYRLALNVTNLTDELTYGSAFFYRAEIVPGRTFALSGSVKF